MAEKSNFENKSPKNFFRQNVRHSVKFQYFELYFFADILILIVLTDSTIKTFFYVKIFLLSTLKRQQFMT